MIYKDISYIYISYIYIYDIFTTLRFSNSFHVFPYYLFDFLHFFIDR